MSPRSVKSNAFDDEYALTAMGLGNANPFLNRPCASTSTSSNHNNDRLVKPPILASSSGGILKQMPPFPVMIANPSSDRGASMRTAPTAAATRKAAAGCERRVIFPTYPRNVNPLPQPTITTTTATTSTTTKETLSLSLPLKVTGCDAGNKTAPRRGSVLPVVGATRNGAKGSRAALGTAQPRNVTTTSSSNSSSSNSSSTQIDGTGRTRRSRSSEDLLKHLLASGLPPTPAPGKTRRVLLAVGIGDNDTSQLLAPVPKEPRHRLLAVSTTRSILCPSPKYSQPRTNPSNTLMVKTKSEDSCHPSLLDVKQEDCTNTDDDDDHSQSSTSNDEVASTTITNDNEDINNNNNPTSQERVPEPLVVATTVPLHPTTLAETPATATKAPCHVAFDPRIWIREFHREPEEATCTWYTDHDMDRFRRLAMERILRYQSIVEILPTGTGRTVQRRVATNNTRGAIFSHAALTLDGENRNDAYLREKVREKELQSILVIDPQDLCCKLFAKALQAALPTTTVMTALSTAEALQYLAQGKRFDMILVEERLQLFHRHYPVHQEDGSNVSTLSSSSSPGKNQESCQSWLCSPNTNNNKDSEHKRVVPPGSCEAIMFSGAALIRKLRQFPSTSNSLLIGVTAHLKEDGPKLQESGADFCWSKPPPPFDEPLLDEMVKTLLVKRGQGVLANELFG